MEDVTSKRKTLSPKKKTPTENSPVAAHMKDPQKEAADQKNGRATGVVALVAAEFQVTVSEVQKTISVKLGYKYAHDNNLELFDTLKTGIKDVLLSRLLSEPLRQRLEQTTQVL